MKIEPLHFLLLVELSLILFVLALFSFSRNKKHKDLYQKTLKKLNALQSEEQTETAPLEEHMPESAPPPQPVSVPASGGEQTGRSDDDNSPSKVKRLQRMVDFQKNTILELMCYKDVFEGARKRLDALQQTNRELQEKIRALIEGGAEGAGFTGTTAALEENNRDLEHYIAILDKENATLSEKFQLWEEQFRRISEDVEETASPENTELSQEKEALAVKVKEVEEKLEEKEKNLEAMKVQYEDLEKEYMILYRQQQQQQQGQQPQ